MNKKELIVLAEKELTQPSGKAARAFMQIRDEAAAEVTRRMMARPDLERLIGSGNEAMMEDNHRNQMRFMESQFQHFQPAVLVETVSWVMSAYPAHGFHLTYWPAVLNQAVEVLREKLDPESFQEIYPFYHWLIVRHPGFTVKDP